jgi:hypothetical protein
VPGTHQWYDGTPHPWEFKRVWHLEPSLHDPDTVYAGVEDAALFRSTDGGQSWHELSGLRKHGSGAHWQPGAGGMGLHTILLDRPIPSASPSPSPRPASSAPTTAARRGAPANKGLTSKYIPDPTPRSATACTTSPCTRPTPTALHAEALGRDAQRRRRRLWREVSGNLPSDFGFPVRRPRARAGDDLRRADQERLEHYPPDGKLRVYRSRTGGTEWEALTNGLPQEALLRQRAARCDGGGPLDPCGVYFGTTGGQVYVARRRRSLAAIASDLPSVLSVEVQTLP